MRRFSSPLTFVYLHYNKDKSLKLPTFFFQYNFSEFNCIYSYVCELYFNRILLFVKRLGLNSPC